MIRLERALRAHPALHRVWELGANLLLVGIYGRFAWRFGERYLETGQLSHLLILVTQSLVALVFLTRRIPSHVDFSLFGWFVALGGTWTMHLFFEPVDSRDSFVGEAILLTGLILQVASILSLNRSFGVVAANRGIKTRGAYRVVRHPLYACYLYSYAGMLIEQFSLRNLAVIVAATVFQILRIDREERLLGQDPEYRAYMQRTRWRLVPFVY